MFTANNPYLVKIPWATTKPSSLIYIFQFKQITALVKTGVDNLVIRQVLF